MATPYDFDDSRPEPNLASSSSVYLPNAVLSAQSSSSVPQHSPALSPVSPEPNAIHLLPTQTLSKFQLPPLQSDAGGIDLDGLPPEIRSADMFMAPDSSFVETSSGLAARELKRLYDQHLGVNKDIRSPYAITAFVNQHGKQMFRVGFREASAPGASAEGAERPRSTEEDGSSTQSRRQSSANHTKRRSRISMHGLLTPAAPKNGVPPPSRTEVRNTPSIGPRKLRKTRSIPDTLFGLTPGASSSTAVAQEQPTPTGRAHSHSVTGADMPRLPTPRVDIPPPPRRDTFADVMPWMGGPSSSSAYTDHPPQSPSSGHAYEKVPLQPFGPAVAFDSPLTKSAMDCLPTPHILREMQSFESGLTARAADPSFRLANKGKAPVLTLDFDDPEESSPFSPSMDISGPSFEVKELETAIPEELPSRVHSRYSTDVFDVLQTYRGLPLLDRISPDFGETAVIRMSLRSDDTAAPRDDPRFVIWGEIQTGRDPDEMSISQGSRTDVSSSSHASRRKGSKASKNDSVNLPSVQLPSEDGTPSRVLLAATIERWIAQLTSDLDYDELLMFLLTYRTYISALDLLHLLICRFHWTLSKDERVRRIVRVRTFVAIRYWLLTFFAVDFLPNRELRLLLADWLNNLVRDPILEKHNDGLSIIRKLRKIVKECKEAHTRRGRNSVSAMRASLSNKPRRSSMSTIFKARAQANHLLGDKFAEAVAPNEEEDSDIDLDFVADGASDTTPAFTNDLVHAHLTSTSPPSKSTPLVSSPALALLQQPLQQTILQQRNRSSTADSSANPVVTPSPNALPVHHNAISRVFVKTLGRLGRWKRVLNSGPLPAALAADCVEVSAFDLELTNSGDLLAVRGGIERYLKVIEQQGRSALHTHTAELTPKLSTDIIPNPASSEPAAALTPTEDSLEPNQEVDLHHTPERTHSPVSSKESEGTTNSTTDVPQPPALHRSPSMDSFASSSHSSSESLGKEIVDRKHWQFDVASIDDLDLSDSSSEHHVAPVQPPGLRKVPRRLPLRRDFELLRRSGESVSSMGISRDSYASGPSTNSAASTSSSGPGLGRNIQQWQMNALIDSLSDEEESGDVEDALRRLEGQINPIKRKEKASKVDGWVRSMRERLAAGNYGDDQPRYFSDEDMATDGDSSDVSLHDADVASLSTTPSNNDEESTGASLPTENASTPIATQATGPSNAGSPPRDTKPALEDVVPIEILQSRVPSRPSTSHGSPVDQKTGIHASSITLISPSSKFGLSNNSRPHRSFILNYRAETLVQHFSMIDRELFMGVKFEELVVDDWMACEEVNVTDWAQYLKDRARWKAESRLPHKTSALAAVRARFNLIANFTLSEIVLTQKSERALVVGKFIRMAWKAYCSSSFNTLVAIISGLRSEWVTKAMRSLWYRVGIWETRMFKDLTEYVSSADDFRHIRQAVIAMVDAKPIINIGPHTPSVVSTGGTETLSNKSKTLSENRADVQSTCIPFIGVYLSQLYRYSRLPDLIDPTAPNEAVGIDPSTGNFDALAHTEVFSSLVPLPPSMQLEPLINVHKQRLIAAVIKSLVAGQHLASRVQYPIDKKLFQKCLKLRGLDSETLRRICTNLS